MLNPGEMTELGPRRRPKASEVVAEEIVNQIIDGNFQEGKRLPAEREMLGLFKVGRSTLREGLRLLETRGVITIRSGRHGGPVVRKLRTTDLSDALTLLLQFERASIADVLFAREAFEPVIAYAAAQKITAQEITVLKETVDLVSTRADRATFVRENQRFHSTLAEAAHNPILLMVSDTLKAITDNGRVGVRYTKKYRQSVVDAHREIIEALEAGDPARSSQAMREHLSASQRHWQAQHANLLSRPVRWVH